MIELPNPIAGATVTRVIAYVDAHYADPISLRHVARAVSYSPAHLTDCFRRATGMGVTAWIIHRRVAEARVLLSSADVSVATVCERVGFNDLRYFTKQFTRITGTTPGRFRAGVRGTRRDASPRIRAR